MSKITDFLIRFFNHVRETSHPLFRMFINKYIFKKAVAIIVTACFIFNIASPAVFADELNLPGEKLKKDKARIEYVLSNPNIPFSPAFISQMKVRVAENGVIMVLEQNKKDWRPLGYWNGVNAYTPKGDGRFSKEGNDGLRQACEQYFKNKNVPVDVALVRTDVTPQQEVQKEKLQAEVIPEKTAAPPTTQAQPEQIIKIQNLQDVVNILQSLYSSSSELAQDEKDLILKILSQQLGIAVNLATDQVQNIISFLSQFITQGGSVVNCAVEALANMLGLGDELQKVALGAQLLLTDILSGTFGLIKSTAANQIFTSATAIQTIAKVNGLNLYAYQADIAGLAEALKSGNVILYLKDHFVTATKVVNDVIYYIDSDGVVKTMSEAQWRNELGGTILTSAQIDAEAVGKNILMALTGAFVPTYAYSFNSATGMVYWNGLIGYLSEITGKVYSIDAVNNVVQVNEDMTNTYYANTNTQFNGSAFSTWLDKVKYVINSFVSAMKDQALSAAEKTVKEAALFASAMSNRVNVYAISNLTEAYISQLQTFFNNLDQNTGSDAVSAYGADAVAAGALLSVLTKSVNPSTGSWLSSVASNILWTARSTFFSISGSLKDAFIAASNQINVNPYLYAGTLQGNLFLKVLQAHSAGSMSVYPLLLDFNTDLQPGQ